MSTPESSTRSDGAPRPNCCAAPSRSVPGLDAVMPFDRRRARGTDGRPGGRTSAVPTPATPPASRRPRRTSAHPTPATPHAPPPAPRKSPSLTSRSPRPRPRPSLGAPHWLSLGRPTVVTDHDVRVFAIASESERFPVSGRDARSGRTPSAFADDRLRVRASPASGFHNSVRLRAGRVPGSRGSSAAQPVIVPMAKAMTAAL